MNKSQRAAAALQSCFESGERDENELIEYRSIGTAEEFRAALRRTAEDERLEREGLLVRLLCKRGDTAYDVYVETFTGDKVVSSARTFGALHIELLHGTLVEETVPLSDIGKTVFLTRQDAEAALSERGGEDV